jgi:hypothetical protein
MEHQGLVIIVAAVPLALGGLVISMWKLRRRWVLPVAAGVLISYWIFMMVDERLVKMLIPSGGSSAAYLAWTPNVVLLLAASALIRVRQTPSGILH